MSLRLLLQVIGRSVSGGWRGRKRPALSNVISSAVFTGRSCSTKYAPEPAQTVLRLHKWASSPRQVDRADGWVRSKL